MKRFCVFTCVLLAVCFTEGNPISFIKKCRADDGKCGKESIQAAIPIYTLGIPELEVAPLDPMFIPKLDASVSGLELIITDSSVRGLSGCKAKKLEREGNSRIVVTVECDVTLDGQYEMKGQLLVLPMEGKGPIHAKIRKLEITVDVDLEEKIVDGKKHWKVKSWRHNYNLKGKADVVFENLFNGNEVLGRAARDLISDNGNEIINEVGPPVIKSIITSMTKNVNRFFRKVPVEDLSLD